jgi:GT2 family glycosyltransferase
VIFTSNPLFNSEAQGLHLDPQSANPLVTAIVLSYNQARFVVETLDSVIAQSYPTTELVIVDDCSSDNSVAIIEDWLAKNPTCCTFIRHRQNQGICKSLNDALVAANGKYISMVASDDVWLPDKIEGQVKMMEAQSDSVGVLYSDAFQIDENGSPLPEMFIAAHRNLPEIPQGDVLNTLLEGNFIPGMTALIRRSCYEKVGLYDEALPWEDWDMWMRIARRYWFVYSPTPSAKYRCHAKSLSHSDRERMLRDCFQVCIKQFRLGQLKEEQKSTILNTLMCVSEELYRRRDPDSREILSVLRQTTDDKKAAWMYRFKKLGFSFETWQRANRWRVRFRRFGVSPSS